MIYFYNRDTGKIYSATGQSADPDQYAANFENCAYCTAQRPPNKGAFLRGQYSIDLETLELVKNS